MTRLKARLTSDPLLAAFAALTFAATLYFTFSLFATINARLSDYTWGDIIWVNQAFWNFTHGRALQTSVYCKSGDGVLFNPWSYSNQLAMHVNLFPYVFAPLYRLKPDVNGLYAIVLLWNYLGIGFFLWKLIERESPDHPREKFLVIISLLWAGSIFPVLAYKALFPLYAGPLIAALVYFLVSRQRAAFLLTGLLLCLVSEDCAMFAVMFSVYAYAFHRKERSYALALAALAAVWIALVVRIIMPATKFDLTMATKDSSDIVIRLKKMIEGDYALQWRSLIPLCLFVISGFSVLRLAMPNPRANWKKYAALTFLAPSTHWLISLSMGTGHHPLPVVVCALAAMALYACEARWSRMKPAALAVGLLLLTFNSFWILKNLRHYSTADPRYQSGEAFLSAASEVPASDSVSYWTDRGLDAFMSSRTDVWRFPINWDKADWLLIQKDSTQSFYAIKDFTKGVEGGEGVVKGATAPNGEAAAWLKKSLAKTHEVAREDEHLLFLRRKDHADIPQPAFSLGFGWARNVARLGSRKAP